MGQVRPPYLTSCLSLCTVLSWLPPFVGNASVLYRTVHLTVRYRLLFGTVPYGTVPYDTVPSRYRYRTVPYCTVLTCRTVPYGTGRTAPITSSIVFSNSQLARSSLRVILKIKKGLSITRILLVTVPYGTVGYGTVWYSRYRTVPYGTVPYSCSLIILYIVSL